MQVLNGWPARSARFITSTASGSCSSNFSSRARRFREMKTNGAAPPAMNPSNAMTRLSDRMYARSAEPIAARTAIATSLCARIECPDCSIIRPSDSMCGESSRRLASGESSRRYFCLSNDATSRSASTASISASFWRSSFRVRASEPNAGTMSTCESRNTAPPSSARNMTRPFVMTASCRRAVRWKRGRAAGQARALRVAAGRRG